MLTEQYGAEARVRIAQLRDDLIKRFKNADIPAEHELQHADVVKPAIEVIQAKLSVVSVDAEPVKVQDPFYSIGITSVLTSELAPGDDTSLALCNIALTRQTGVAGFSF